MVRSVVRMVAGTLLALALCGGAFASPAALPAQAATTFQVVVGGASEDGAVDLNAFLPSVVTLNEGDTITWNQRGFHTVTFLSGAPPIPLVITTSDNLPALNPAVLGPSGGPNYDGSGVVNSGVFTSTFALTFTKAGSYSYICLVHSGQAGRVVVQAADSALPETPAQVDSRANAERFDKLAFGTSLIANAKLTSKANADGTTNYTALNGVGGNQTSVLRFLPVEMTIKAGDSVTWRMDDPHEVHTVTFFDTSGPPPLAEFFEERPQPNGPPLQVFRGLAPKGGAVVDNPKGFYNSGAQVVGQSSTFTFPNPGVYNYVCIIHPEAMTGKVTVQGAVRPVSLPTTGTDAQSPTLLAIAGGAVLLMLMGALLLRRRAR